MIEQTRWYPVDPGRRRYVFVLIAALAVVLGRAAPSSAVPVFKLAEDSTVVLRGVVERVQSYKQDAFYVFTVTPREVLKGPATVGTSVLLVQERVFGSEPPYFAAGDETFIAAVPLPPYSYYRQALPAASYLRWTDVKVSANDIAELRVPAVGAAVARYLALAADRAAAARHLATLLASDVPLLRADALSTLVARRDLAATLDTDALAPVRTLLRAERIPLPERSAILVGLARAGAPGIGDVAEELATAGGPLEASAVEALIIVGRVPAEKRLLAWSRSDDTALRLAAVRGLARSTSRAGFDRMTDIVRADPAPEVRIAALQALGETRDPRAVDVLAHGLRSSDKNEILAASAALASIRSPEAVRVLASTLRDGSFDAEVASAFALNQSDTEEAMGVLREQRDVHPDPEVRKVIKLTLGEQHDEHAE